MKRKRLLVAACLIGIAGSSSGETVQSYCDTAAGNAQKMYGDLTSSQFRSGEVTYGQLVENYSKQTSLFASNLNLELLKQINAQKDVVSEQDVINWIYRRCASDYDNYQRWWRANSRGRPSDILAPAF